MIKLLGRANSINVQKVHWCLEELGLPYERTDVGGAFGGNNTPEYLAKNPNGRVPTLEDDGFVLWESNVIVRYLAAKHSAGKLWPTDVEGARRGRPLDGLAADGAGAGDVRGLLGADPDAARASATRPRSRNRRQESAAVMTMLDAHLKGRALWPATPSRWATSPSGAGCIAGSICRSSGRNWRTWKRGMGG